MNSSDAPRRSRVIRLRIGTWSRSVQQIQTFNDIIGMPCQLASQAPTVKNPRAGRQRASGHTYEFYREEAGGPIRKPIPEISEVHSARRTKRKQPYFFTAALATASFGQS